MKKLPLRYFAPAIFMICLSGCVTTEYRPPSSRGLAAEQTSRVLDADIEQVWHVFETFPNAFRFMIESVNRQDGVVSGKFTADPELYVDGGLLVKSGGKSRQQYAEYMLSKNLKLNGVLDVYLKEAEAGKTSVTVNVQYTVQVPGQSFENAFTGELVTKDPTTWYFDSKGCAESAFAGDPAGTAVPVRTFTSNGELERQVLDELEGLL